MIELFIVGIIDLQEGAEPQVTLYADIEESQRKELTPPEETGKLVCTKTVYTMKNGMHTHDYEEEMQFNLIKAVQKELTNKEKRRKRMEELGL